jgi:DNA mismatch repair protein MutH
MMARSQISLDPELQRRARQRAGELGISLAEYVRSLVARDLKRRKPKSDVSVIFGLGSSGGSDIARDKDRMVGEAVAANRKRRSKR